MRRVWAVLDFGLGLQGDLLSIHTTMESAKEWVEGFYPDDAQVEWGPESHAFVGGTIISNGEADHIQIACYNLLGPDQ